MAEAHVALPDGFDDKIRDIADALGRLDPFRLSPDAFFKRRDELAGALFHIARWPHR